MEKIRVKTLFGTNSKPHGLEDIKELDEASHERLRDRGAEQQV